MRKEIKTLGVENRFNIEAYYFEGYSKPFPAHFHDYYVIGYVETGERKMTYKAKNYVIGSGDIILLNPGDNHGCAQNSGESFNYRSLNISKETMLYFSKELTGKNDLPFFSDSVIKNRETADCFLSLHRMIMEDGDAFEKEELLYTFISCLFEMFGNDIKCSFRCKSEVGLACDYMKENYFSHISLDELCSRCKLSKSSLLRAFTMEKGITPYRYLQSVRIEAAKKLLEKGISLADTALQTGFYDQSHFTNTFNAFIGLSPSAYRKIFKQSSGGKNE